MPWQSIIGLTWNLLTISHYMRPVELLETYDLFINEEWINGDHILKGLLDISSVFL